jgi:hypothetical protein
MVGTPTFHPANNGLIGDPGFGAFFSSMPGRKIDRPGVLNL